MFEDAEEEVVAEAAAEPAPGEGTVPGAGDPLPRRRGVRRGEGAANIKSHHNVGGLPEDMTFQLVEPLRALFKDEVRAVGAELGLPAEMVQRHPFPGPGLGIRIIGDITQERLSILRRADAIARQELSRSGLEAGCVADAGGAAGRRPVGRRPR